MNRILIFTALLAASLSAKAQTTTQQPLATSKCFCEPKPLQYSKSGAFETLIINDSTYTLDWASRDVVIEGQVYKMEKVTRYDDAVEVAYDQEKVITLLYKGGKCIDYMLEQ